MLYLLDANILITAENSYYGSEMVPEYWDWLLHMGRRGDLKIPLETYSEVVIGSKKGKDALSLWMEQEYVSDALLLNEAVSIPMVQRVLAEAYAEDLNDTEVEQIGQDPFLIAYACVDPTRRCVVSNEAKKPTARRSDRRIPNACDDVGVQCCDTFAMLRRLGFKTGWDRAA